MSVGSFPSDLVASEAEREVGGGGEGGRLVRGVGRGGKLAAGGMESTEGVETAREDRWRAMEAGGGTVAGRKEGGIDPERGEDEEEGGRRALLEGEWSRGALAVECGCGFRWDLGSTEGVWSRGESGGKRGDLIRRPRWVWSIS